jgi:hypothetical protein
VSKPSTHIKIGSVGLNRSNDHISSEPNWATNDWAAPDRGSRQSQGQLGHDQHVQRVDDGSAQAVV